MSVSSKFFAHSLLTLALGAGLIGCSPGVADAATGQLPDPKANATSATAGEQVAVFAGGCFWGVEAVFEHLKGVKQVSSGYAGGSAATASYALVSSGATGHAEAVRIVFDPAVVSYGQLLKVFFSVAHNPTQLNRQGPDRGPQYRSAIFAGDPEQARIARDYIAQLGAAKAFDQPIVTQVTPLVRYFEAEAYHQDYARLNPNEPYIVIHDAPKVKALERQFPTMYRP